jgi:hypothetical protein
MIQNRNLSRAAKKRTWNFNIRPLTADLQSHGFQDPENDVRILRIDLFFAEASGASEDEIIEVGTIADDDLYLSYTVADNQTIGTKVAGTLLSTALLPAGTVLIAKKSAAAADASSTAVISGTITYEIIDKKYQA